MKKYLVLLGALITILFMTWGCSTATEKSESVNQDRIYQSYSATYEQEGDKTSGAAHFTFGDISGTTLELTGKGGISHNLFDMVKKSFAGTFYMGGTSGFKNTHSFSYTDTNGKVYLNTIEIIPISFRAAPASISRTSNLNIDWEGASLAENETITLILSDNNTGTNFATFSTKAVGSTSIALDSSKLSTLTNGAKVMSFERRKWLPLQQGASAGGNITATYTTSKISVTLN